MERSPIILPENTSTLFISDTHANFLALKSLFESEEVEGIKKIISLGDLIALGPNPIGIAEIFKKIKEKLAYSLGGNTDQENASGIRIEENKIIQRKHEEMLIEAGHTDFLDNIRNLPDTITSSDWIAISHYPNTPDKFENETRVHINWHEHKQTGIISYCKNGNKLIEFHSEYPKMSFAEEFELDLNEELFYTINVWSVGDFRDGEKNIDTFASAVIIERIQDILKVKFLRVQYSKEKLINEINTFLNLFEWEEKEQVRNFLLKN